ncbi:hypothetical protein [Marinobacter salicampi]|uniref:hypothetical protein n=1 Tax=Marinobacter salicampi TaxID=435907 RepID=UPI0014093740|nr:hypothetical protein [Marinobacter salicampi]
MTDTNHTKPQSPGLLDVAGGMPCTPKMSRLINLASGGKHAEARPELDMESPGEAGVDLNEAGLTELRVLRDLLMGTEIGLVMVAHDLPALNRSRAIEAGLRRTNEVLQLGLAMVDMEEQLQRADGKNLWLNRSIEAIKRSRPSSRQIRRAIDD